MQSQTSHPRIGRGTAKDHGRAEDQGLTKRQGLPGEKKNNANA